MINIDSRPRFSVIIPCYNAHIFIDDAIASLRAQTVDDLEIIVVDDGSTDPETVSCLQSLPDDVRVIRQENKGLPGARNAGIRASRGVYILPLDCDDWLEPDFLEKTFAALQEDPDISFSCASFRLEGEASGVLIKSYNHFEQLFFNQLPYCLLMPRRIWDEVGGYDETMRRGYEDWEFNIRLGQHGYFGKVVSEPLFHYRVQRTGMLKSLSSTLHAQLWGEIQNRHPAAYGVSNLARTWVHWRKCRSTYRPFLLWGWFILYRILPDRTVNRLFSSLQKLSHSNRVGRNEDGGEKRGAER